MTAERLRVLLVEDREEDAELLLRRLASAGFAPEAERVESAGAMEAALRRESWDIALLDYRLPGFSGLGALALVRDLGLDLPCIIVSGTIDEDSAVTALKAGAANFVLKDNLTRLGPAIVREVREARDREQLAATGELDGTAEALAAFEAAHADLEDELRAVLA